MANLYEVGQKVVCVDTNWVGDNIEKNWPVLNCIYTIRELVLPTAWTMDIYGWQAIEDDLAFRFFEIASVGSFYHWHFRPLKKTETGEFRGLLRPLDELLKPRSRKKVKETEDA